MTTISWSDELKRGLGFQDEDHEQAVKVMNALHGCSDAELPALFEQLFTHTAEHLARENELMERIGFFAYGMHKGEHDRVLAELQEFKDKLDAKDLDAVRHYVEVTVPNWFIDHLNSMDTITAQFALQAGEK
ncbi:hemerythrin family protein [Magnetovibrio sp. PR-2]|uniref:bacteriohemerythrin n=1 Tax=Magnetovibrio sp. PR-2 TaxID=3120356 RepID=UPI002FCE2AE3